MLTLVAIFAALAAQDGDAEAAFEPTGITPGVWTYEVVPNGGEPITAESVTADAEGVTIGEGERRAWSAIRRLDVIPPEGWTKGSKVVIREDGKLGVTSTVGSIKLNAQPGGYHRFHVAYVHLEGDPTLRLEVKGGGFSDWQPLPSSLLYQPRESGNWNKESESPGFDADGFRLPDRPSSLKRGVTSRIHLWGEGDEEPLFVRDIRSTPLLGYKSMQSFGPPSGTVNGRELDGPFACVIYGLIRATGRDETQFRLTADGLSQMSIGGWPPDLPERTRPPKETEWDATLGRGGFARGVLDGFADDALRLRPQMGLNDEENETKMPEVPIGRDLLLELWRSDLSEEVERIDEPADSDVLYAAGKSGEVRGVVGKLMSIAGEDLTFQLGGEDRTLPLERVRGVVFARSPLTDRSTVAEPSLTLDLLGPTRIPGSLIGFKDGTFRFQPLGGGPEMSVGRYLVDGVISTGGGNLRLTDLTPKAERTPYFDLPPVFLTDETPEGVSPRVGSDRFRRYFAVGPRTALTFDLSGGYDRFTTTVGMPAMAGDPPGDAAVSVRSGDEVLFERTSLTAEDGSVPLSIDISGRESLTLEVDFGAGGDTNDLVLWGDPEVTSGAMPETSE